jgi:hypothetical protein
VDRQLLILPVTTDNNTLQDVLFDGGFGVNMITKEEWLQLGLPTP